MPSKPVRMQPTWLKPKPLRRRDALAGLAACVTSLLPARSALAQSAGLCVLAPEAGEGPFYFDPGLVRSDIAERSTGAPLDLEIQVARTGDCAILANARVDVWHADGFGLYSGYERQRGTGERAPSAADRTSLRGTQYTDVDGHVRFRTIYPSWYAGRTPHVHFKIFLGDDEVVASQMFFPDDVNNEVFATMDPYRDQRDRRDTFNENDSFLVGRTEGVFASVQRAASGYRATLVVGVRAG